MKTLPLSGGTSTKTTLLYSKGPDHRGIAVRYDSDERSLLNVAMPTERELVTLSEGVGNFRQVDRPKPSTPSAHANKPRDCQATGRGRFTGSSRPFKSIRFKEVHTFRKIWLLIGASAHASSA